MFNDVSKVFQGCFKGRVFSTILDGLVSMFERFFKGDFSDTRVSQGSLNWGSRIPQE